MASLCVAVLRQIAQHQVVTLLALQHLRQRVAADRGLDGVLHIGHIDLVARRLLGGPPSRSGSVGRARGTLPDPGCRAPAHHA